MLPTPVFIVCFLDREKRQDDEEQMERKIITPPGGVLPTLFNKEGKKKKKNQIIFLDTTPAFNVCVSFYFFLKKNVSHFQRVSYTVHETHKFLFSTKNSLKIRHTIPFTHLKIILLQYFQFQFLVTTLLHKN